MSDWLIEQVSGLGWGEARYEWLVVLTFVVGLTLFAHIIGSLRLHFYSGVPKRPQCSWTLPCQ